MIASKNGQHRGSVKITLKSVLQLKIGGSFVISHFILTQSRLRIWNVRIFLLHFGVFVWCGGEFCVILHYG